MSGNLKRSLKKTQASRRSGGGATKGLSRGGRSSTTGVLRIPQTLGTSGVDQPNQGSIPSGEDSFQGLQQQQGAEQPRQVSSIRQLVQQKLREAQQKVAIAGHGQISEVTFDARAADDCTSEEDTSVEQGNQGHLMLAGQGHLPQKAVGEQDPQDPGDSDIEDPEDHAIPQPERQEAHETEPTVPTEEDSGLLNKECDNTCPVCKKVFKNSRGVKQHLRRGAGNACAKEHRDFLNTLQEETTSPQTSNGKRTRYHSDSEGSEAARTSPSSQLKNKRKLRRKGQDNSRTNDEAPIERHNSPETEAPTSERRDAIPTANTPIEDNRETPPIDTQQHPTAQHPQGHPISRRRPIRIPRLAEEARERLDKKLSAIAQETLARVKQGTWKEVEAAATNFTSKIYEAIWYADKKPGQQEQKASRQRQSTELTETQKPRISPRIAQAQDNVHKALLALREAEKAQRGQKGASQEQHFRKRALEKHLRNARRRLISVLHEESANQLQALYIRDRRRCVEELLADEGQPQKQDCTIQLEELERHFREQHSEHSIDITSQEAREFLQDLQVAPMRGAGIDPRFTAEDVRAQLQKSNLSAAAGPDGIGFLVYKRFEGVLAAPLAALYNACAQHRKVPKKWKESVTVLIPKGGDPDDVKNWRPINLQDCIYKIYAAMWASRITDWAIKNGVASKSQKGFMPVNGCHEHIFLSQSILNTTRRQKRAVYMAYYDLKNAFGSLPHALIHAVLRQQQLPQQAREVIADLYDGASFCVSTKEGYTGTIANRRGVKQGCPLSPILFNLALEPLLQKLSKCDNGFKLRTPDEASAVEVTHTAYADDLKTVASTPQGIRTLHQWVERFLHWTGLEANPSKCATMGLKLLKGKQTPNPAELRLHGEVLPKVKLGEAYKYLGVRDALETSVHHDQILRIMHKARKDIYKLLRSALLPWQKLDAIRTFVMSRLDYHLRHCYPYKQQLIAFDSHMRYALREAFKLPKGTATELYHQATAHGGLGCTSIQTVAAATQIGHGLQLLNSPDTTVSSVAEGQVIEVLRKAFIYTPDGTISDKKAILAYLNGKPLDCLKKKGRKTGDLRSLWSELPSTIAACKLEIDVTPAGRYIVKKQGGALLDQNRLIRSMKEYMGEQQQEIWKDKPDQGKSVAYQSAESNAFLRGPTHLKPAEVNFALKARCAQLPTRSYLRKIGVAKTTRCRHCTANPETLAHILNHCPHHMDSKIKGRHNAALERIVTAIKTSRANKTKTLTVDKSPPDIETQLRPDLILRDDKAKTLAIVDLAITFEDHKKNAFADARARKQEKYNELKQEYVSRGYQVTLDALVYGSLGCIDRENFSVLTKALNVSKTEIRRLQRLISLDCIKHSHKIWAYHAADNGMRAGRGGGSK